MDAGAITRAARRKRARGAAMAESLVAIPFFILMFAGIVYMGNLYRGKLKTHRLSMEKAWTDSLGGCDEAATGRPLPMTANIDLGEAAGTPQAQLCETGFSWLSEEAAGTVNRPAMLNGGTTQVGTVTHLICNEDPESGDFEGAAEFLWKQFATKEFEVSKIPGAQP